MIVEVLPFYMSEVMDKTMKLSTSGLGQQHGHEGAYLFFFFSCLLFISLLCFF